MLMYTHTYIDSHFNDEIPVAVAHPVDSNYSRFPVAPHRALYSNIVAQF